MILKINKIPAIFTALWVCVIFGFTLQSGEISSDLSGGILGQILSLFNIDSLSEPQLETLHTVLRKCGHFAEFFILGVLSFIALSRNEIKKRFLLSAGFCAVIASIDETIQLFFPDREGKIWDVLLDCTGAIAGIAAMWLVVVLTSRKKSK